MAFLDKQVSWVKGNKVKAAVVGIILLGVFVELNMQVLHFSSSPPFCKGLCHTMNAEVVDWEASSHGQRHVDCVSCHFREGAINYMINKVYAMNDVKNTLTGNMARAMDEEEHFGNPEHLEYITEEQLAEEHKMEDVVLPQYIHNPEKDLGATPSNYADEDGNWRIQMHRYGFLWRIVNENCVNCHSSKGSRGIRSDKNVADFIVEDALFEFGDEVSRQEKPNIAGRRPLGGIKAPHAFHQDRGIACIDCHQEIVHGSQELKDDHFERSGRRGNEGVVWPRMIVCFRCHNNERAPRDCLYCHEYQKNMNLGINGVDVDQTDGYMYPDNADCTDCHMEENNWKMSGQICADCHDDEGMVDTLAEWQSATTSSLAELAAQLSKTETAIDEARKHGRDVTGTEELFNAAYQNYKMVWYDGSKGAHNIDFAEALLTVSQEKLKLAEDMLVAY